MPEVISASRMMTVLFKYNGATHTATVSLAYEHRMLVCMCGAFSSYAVGPPSDVVEHGLQTADTLVTCLLCIAID